MFLVHFRDNRLKQLSLLMPMLAYVHGILVKRNQKLVRAHANCYMLNAKQSKLKVSSPIRFTMLISKDNNSCQIIYK